MTLPAIRSDWVLWGLAAGVGLVALNAVLSGRLLTSSAQAVGRAPVDLFVGGLEGLFGLPDTRTDASKTRCQQALESGNDWEASFSCPAADAVRGWFDGEWF